MSYTPIKTITVTRNRLCESDDLTQPLSTFASGESYLLVRNKVAVFTLSINDLLTDLSHLDITQPIGQVFNGRLNDLLVERFSTTDIPLAISPGLYNNRLRVLNPISYKDYRVHFTSVDTPYLLDDVDKRGYLDDLVIISADDLSQCLVAVNGVFHQTTYFNNQLFVLDGYRTIRLTGRHDVVLVDTKAIGGHTLIPLTTANVSKPAYQQAATVTLTQSIANKTVFAVIDGYFYHRDQRILKIADATHLKISCNKLPLIQQFRHNPRTVRRPDRYGPDATQTSRKYTDGYEAVFLNNSAVPSSTLANADFQYSRLTHFHSFLVVFNNPNVFTLSTAVTPSGTLQFYTDAANRALSGMASYGCGLCPSYLIWRDPHQTKSIFLPHQDNDVDWQDHSINPPFIPDLITDPLKARNIPLQFVDYVSS
jgi:hypothetical protein